MSNQNQNIHIFNTNTMNIVMPGNDFEMPAGNVNDGQPGPGKNNANEQQAPNLLRRIHFLICAG